MAVPNAIMENYTYNLTKIISADIINDTPGWIFNFNSELGGFLVVSFLAVLAIVLFILARRLEGVKDSKAAVYSGLVVSVIALLLFFVDAGAGAKILSFNQLMIFLVATSLAILIDRIARNY